MNWTLNCFRMHRILQIWLSLTFFYSQTSSECSLERNLSSMMKYLSKLRSLLRLKTNCTIKMVSKNCMTTIIVALPLKATVLNNKIKFYRKNVFFLCKPMNFSARLLDFSSVNSFSGS